MQRAFAAAAELTSPNGGPTMTAVQLRAGCYNDLLSRVPVSHLTERSAAVSTW